MLTFTGERMIPELNHSAGFYYEHIARYLFASHFCKGKKVLDVGSGAGYGSSLLLTHGKAMHVCGIDIDFEAIKHSQKKYGQNRLTFSQDSAEQLDTIKDKSIDVVVCFELIEHIVNQDRCIENIHRVLKPDGLLVISTPNKYIYPSGNQFHLKELYLKQFIKLLSGTFKYVKTAYQSLHLAQVIHEDIKPIALLKDHLIEEQAQAYTLPPKEKSEEYLICIASSKKISPFQAHISTNKKLDFIDLQKGLIEFEKKYYENTGSQHQRENEYLKQSLETITSSKFYKVWQCYCTLRDKLLQVILHEK